MLLFSIYDTIKQTFIVMNFSKERDFMQTEKTIQGKKVRPQMFDNAIIIAILLICNAVVCAFFPTSDYAIVSLIMTPMILILVLATIISSRYVICVLCEDRLYYYISRAHWMEFVVVSGSRRKVVSNDGWIMYYDIQKCEYLPATRRLPSRVVLYGADFELTIPGVGRRFIKQIEERQESYGINFTGVSSTTVSQLQTERVKRDGLWKDIWESFENGTLENVISDYEIVRIEANEDIDVIDICINAGGQEIDFNIDDSSIFMLAPEIDVDKTIYHENIADLDTLFSAMREFISCNY